MKNTLYVIKLKKNADNKKGAAAILNKAEESYERERENEYTLYGLNYENFKISTMGNVMVRKGSWP